MQHTTLSAPSFDDAAFLTKYQAIEGNESKTVVDFYNFLSTPAIRRDMFLFDAIEYVHLKAKIVISNLIPS